MPKTLIIVCLLFLFGRTAYSQPELEVQPKGISFENWFDRLENIRLINKGDSSLVIDTIYYKSSLYYVRYDKYWHYPLTISPGDTILMDCILAGYFDVTSADTADTMYIYSNSINGEEEIKVEIEPFDDSERGTLTGKITNEGNPVEGAKVYALYDGNYIIRSVFTNNYGNYTMSLPEGTFIIAAEKDSFCTTFYGQKSEPYNSMPVTIDKGDKDTANVSLLREVTTGNSVSGKIYDEVSRTALKKAIVIMKKGRHNPRKPNSTNLNDDCLTVFVKPDGSYSAILADADYYYIQSFSDYFLPAYYSDNNSSVFWQEADSVFISSAVEGKDIFLPRDSSYGAGAIEGSIIIDGLPVDSLSGILVLARSVETNSLYGYAFSNDLGEFKVTNLPYGNYRLFLQEIGSQDIYSDEISITPESSEYKNVVVKGIIASENPMPNLPGKLELSQNYPNPFNPSTLIEFSLPSGTEVTLCVFNVLGEEVEQLYHGFLSAGKYDYEFNGSGLSSGAYFVILKAGDSMLTRKILLLK